jgi:hypothetical protein
MTAFDSKGKIRNYKTPDLMLKEFFVERLKLYVKRRDFIVKRLKQEVEELQNVVRYMKAIKNKDIVFDDAFTNQSLKEKLVKDGYLRKNCKKGAEPKLSDFSYLTDKKHIDCTKENVDALTKKADDKVEEYTLAEATTVKQMYLKELDACLKKFNELEGQLQEERVEERKSSKKRKAETNSDSDGDSDSDSDTDEEDKKPKKKREKTTKKRTKKPTPTPKKPATKKQKKVYVDLSDSD